MSELSFTPSGIWASFKSLLNGGDLNDGTAAYRSMNATVNEAEEVEELPEVHIDTAALFDPARRIVDPREKQAKIGPIEEGQETRASEEFKPEGVTLERPVISIREFEKANPFLAGSPIFNQMDKALPHFQSQMVGAITDFTSNTIDGIGSLLGEDVDGRMRTFARQIPTIEKYDNIGASVARSLTEYSLAFIPALGITSKALQGTNIATKALASDTIAGAFADFFTQKGSDKKLADLMLEKLPGLRNLPIMGDLLEYVEGDPGDTELKGRWKNVVDGFFLNAGIGMFPNAKKIKQDFTRITDEVQRMNFYRKYLNNEVGAIGEGANSYMPNAGLGETVKLTPQQEARKTIGEVDINYKLAQETASRKKIDKVKLTQEAKKKQIPLEELDNLSPDVNRTDVQRLAFVDAMTANSKGINDAAIKITKNYNDDFAKAELDERMNDIGKLMAEYVGKDTTVGKQILSGEFKEVATSSNGVGRIMQVLDTYRNASTSEVKDFAIKLSKIPHRKTMRYLRMTGAYLKTGKPWRKAMAEAYISSLLALPVTQAANIIGNGTMATGLVLERGAAGVISKMPGLRDSPITITESGYLAYGMVSSIWAGMKGFAHHWKDSFKSPGLIDLNNKIDAYSPAISAKPLGLEGTMLGGLADFIGHVMRLPLTNLGASDAFFETILKEGERHALSYRRALEIGQELVESGAVNATEVNRVVSENYKNLIDNTPDEILQRMENFSHYGTFKNAFTSEGAKWVQRHLTAKPELKAIIPFWQSPTRVAQANLKRVPLIGGLMSDPQELAATSLSEAKALNLAKQSVGAAIGTIAAYLQLNGKLIGNGPAQNDTKSRALMNSKSIKPLSIPVSQDEKGNILSSIPISKLLGGYGVVLRLGADVNDITKAIWAKAFDDELTPEEEEAYTDYIQGYIATTAEIFKDQVFFKNVLDIYDKLESGNTSGLERLAASPLPRLSEEVAKVFDQKVKETDNLKELLMSKIPGLRNFVPSKTDLFGNDFIDGMGTYGEDNHPGLVAWMVSRFNPAQATGFFNEDLQPVYDFYGKYQRVLPSARGDVKKLGNVKLTNKQREAYKKIRAGFEYKTDNGVTIPPAIEQGMTLNEQLLSIVNDPVMTDLEKIYAINISVTDWGKSAEKILREYDKELDDKIKRQIELGTAAQREVASKTQQ